MWLKISLFSLYLLLGFFKIKYYEKGRKDDLLKTKASVLDFGLKSSLTDCLIFFTTFSLLTFSFIWQLLILQVLFVLIISAIENVIRAYLGIDTNDKSEKFSSLELLTTSTMMIGMKEIYTKIPNVIPAISTCVLIYSFWYFPLNDPTGNTLIMLFLYLIPTLSTAIILFIFYAAEMSSFDIDGEQRDFLLIKSLSNLFRLVSKFSLPLIFMKVLDQKFVFSENTVWIFVAIPFMLFVSIIIIPFFIGHNRHKNYIKSLMLDYRYFINETLNAIYSPNIQEKENNLKELRTQITKDHKIIGIENKYNLYSAFTEVDVQGREQAEVWQKRLSENKLNLLRWDFSIYYYKKMCELLRHIESENSHNLESYLKYNLQNINSQLDDRKYFRSTFIILIFTMVSGCGTYFFRIFEHDISAFLIRLQF